MAEELPLTVPLTLNGDNSKVIGSITINNPEALEAFKDDITLGLGRLLLDYGDGNYELTGVTVGVLPSMEYKIDNLDYRWN